MSILLVIAFAIVFGYVFGRLRGERTGIAYVANSVRGTGRHFTATEVIVGNVVSWAEYEKNQFDHEGTVDGVPSASRNASSKHEASVLVSGTEGYRHPFLSGATDE